MQPKNKSEVVEKRLGEPPFPWVFTTKVTFVLGMQTTN